MPYNIWCEGCKKHIGMGVRYNAEKTKIGMYYTTPVYSFRMKCHLCPNKITIKTDPGNMDYIITEGARRVEQRWDPSQNGQIVPDDKRVGRKLADDAMYKVEHQKSDQDKSGDAAPRISQLSQIQDRVKDDWLANKMLRDAFRAGKKERKAQLAKDKLITGKCGLELDLVPEEQEDVRMARLLNGLSKTDADQRRQEEVGDIKNKDIFAREKDVAESEARSNRTDKKLLALKTIGKATKGKQSELLNRKGFGLVVSKVKEKNTQILKDIATTSKPTASDSSSSKSNSKSVQDASSAPPESSSVPAASAEASSPSLISSSCEQSSVNGSSANESSSSANNSLSMLFSQYDA